MPIEASREPFDHITRACAGHIDSLGVFPERDLAPREVFEWTVFEHAAFGHGLYLGLSRQANNRQSGLLAGDGASDYQWNDIHIDEYDCGPISS